MIGFNKWLAKRILEQQQMMFSIRPREVYHGSNTGTNNSALQSFQARGIQPNIAQGYGQGAGFFVFSDKQTALNHTNSIVNNDNVQTQADTGGLPMIVTIEAILDPEQWDLDYEMNTNVILKWLHNNWATVKDQLADILNLSKTKVINQPATQSSISPGQTYPAQQGFQFAPTYGDYAGGNRRKTMTLQNGRGGDVGEGELMGQIMNKLQQKDPNVTRPFEEKFFANMGPGVAIKYVGQQPLKPKKIEVLQNNQWVDAQQLGQT